jgi:hypothetical protein
MIKLQGEKKMRFFWGIAIVEHLLLTLVLAGFMYTEPPRKPDDRSIRVDLIVNEQKEKIPEVEIPIVIPPIQQPKVSHELPPLRFKDSVQRYLGVTPSTGGLPDLPRTRASSQNPDRFSLGGTASQGRSRDLLDDKDVSATVRAKPLVESAGHSGLSERRGIPEGDTQQHKRGRGGQSLVGNLSTGGVKDTGTERLTGGVGYEVSISGEVSGRGFALGNPLQTEGKQGGGVQLSFKVRPDGTVFDVRIKPGPKTTIGEVRLKEKARAYVENIRFGALPKNIPQVVQTGEIFINFTTQTNVK